MREDRWSSEREGDREVRILITIDREEKDRGPMNDKTENTKWFGECELFDRE